ncbi:MAG TPA: bifunctional 2-C-methyl-D-erythritol 4-phosphate cytidylyltransferase/2-C-methyl-D-erythritol 2,4-cyclodiphosphate synthase [Pseudolabrys sp.]|jgi:2-C-methyl-D-erythritol 4-phosphate cytidylyltransferase / 2-C-methyl-D-erythritol 2,4-cyclodiphosphate synthase|nr:bifunctional 2-C-methyl-D-erythritol 4-phosphate cytidylyltransferase/2-C-methyl-D-erythritol 2,4-cyclodiphosphate synthase [Pseudolabrys sp.]
MAQVAAVVVAAGQGLRAGGEIPKQFRRIAGETLLERALSAFAEAPDVTFVQPVIRPDDVDLVRRLTDGMNVLEPVAGGATRQASVRAGLEALVACTPDIVLIHDAARPFASASLITRAIAAAEKTGAAIPALPVTDTVKRIDSTGTIEATLDRNSIRLVQTPQAFAFPALFDAHRRALAQGRNDFTDDAALAEWAGIKVSVFAGEPGNIKFTTPEDFARAEAIQSAGLGDVRTGSGLDVHAFGPGDHVTLGGIRIPHVQALTGHSDADVALHALTDAILGALADGDIGAHFPPSDPQWRGASSDRFLTFAVERVRARGGRIAHLDLTIVCEAPRIGEHRDRMRANIANLAGIGIERVGVKATTSEKLGFTGRGEGIAAYATATIRLPWD